MIVTRGLGRAAVLGAIVAFGLSVDQAAAATFSGGNARIGATPIVDVFERIGQEQLDVEQLLGEEILAGSPERAGAALLDEEGRAGGEALAAADERVGAASLTQRSRIGGGRLKKH